jgi:predicted TIM-barrel fold metal-dependent hydrolase
MSKSRLAWLKLRKKTAPELPYEPPIFLGNKSNGEFFHTQTPAERKIRDEILRQCDDKARKLGMDRREFIASAMGMCTSLSVLNLAAGCGDKRGHMSLSMADKIMDASIASAGGGHGGMGAGGTGQSGSGGSVGQSRPVAVGYDAGIGGNAGSTSSSAGAGGMSAPPDGQCAPACVSRGQPDGGFCIPHEATLDCDMARKLVGGEEFIFDLQTHHVMPGQFAFVLSPCEINGKPGHDGDMQMTGDSCAYPENYVEQIFLDSDTTVAVLSGLPSSVDPMTGDLTGFSNMDMVNSRTRINMAAASQRMVNHCQVGPDSSWDAVSAMMGHVHNELGHVGWKAYPPASTGGGPWWLDGPVGDRFITRALELGDPLICVHKGFALPTFDPTYCDPKDVGPAALKFPKATFIIYHSAYGLGNTEGPYDPNGQGVDRLVKTVQDSNLKDKNVYAEMGSAWLLSSGDPMAAQHYVGKMLKHIGTERLLWGSECVWFGSPQRQIEAFRTFTISKEFQDMYGYPELTKELKANIFGLNAAKLYCVDPSACRYEVDQSLLAQKKRQLDSELGDRRWAFERPAIKTRREFVTLIKRRRALGELG